jgi:signal peptidase I
MDMTSTKPRRPWLAGLMSLLCGPLGQFYAGRLRRCICLYIFGVLLSFILMLCAIVLPIGYNGLTLLYICVIAYPVYLAIDAFLLAKRNRQTVLKRYQRWWFYLVMYFMFLEANYAIAIFLRVYIAEAFVIPTRSMAPTIQAGNRILVDKLFFSREHLCRSNVIVYRGPDQQFYVTRIAGLPDDTVEIKNERVLINGEEWDDGHAIYQGDLPPVKEMVNYGPIKIPPQHVFVLGDNRRKSRDSRFIGPIPISDVCGKARIIYWAQERVFPDPDDTKNYELGPIHWERMGMRLD